MIIELTVLPADAGQRADAWLSAQLEGQSRAMIQKLMEAGAILLQERPVSKNQKTATGQTYTVDIPEPEPDRAEPQDIPLDIVYEDDDVVVINKPRGMVVHPAAGHADGTMVNALLFHCGDSLSGIGGVLRPGIVHRIDRDTSGLLVVAKHDEAHQALSAQLSDHSMYRIYYAVVVGTPKNQEGMISAPIGRDPRDRKRMAVTARGGKPAVTHYRVLEQFAGFSLVECRLETGRTHQIRVHMSHIGHPVLGDEVYGGMRKAVPLTGQCLHAKTLRFFHPAHGEEVTFEAPLPDYFEEVLERLRRTV